MRPSVRARIGKIRETEARLGQDVLAPRRESAPSRAPRTRGRGSWHRPVRGHGVRRPGTRLATEPPEFSACTLTQHDPERSWPTARGSGGPPGRAAYGPSPRPPRPAARAPCLPQRPMARDKKGLKILICSRDVWIRPIIGHKAVGDNSWVQATLILAASRNGTTDIHDR